MNEKDLQIQQLRAEVEKWKGYAVKAADKACFECDTCAEKHCQKCLIRKIREEAART